MLLLKRIIIWASDLRKRQLFNSKIKKIRKSLVPAAIKPSGNIQSLHMDFWKRSFGKAVRPDWFKVYSYIYGHEDYRFVPESLYYTEIEPRLNNKAFSKAFTAKSHYQYFIDNSLLPETIVYNEEGVLYSGKTGLPVLWDIVCESPLMAKSVITKPATDSGGGKGVILWERKGDNHKESGGETLDPAILTGIYGKNWILQPYIEQHNYFAGFNSSSVNTIRIFTYRSVLDEEIRVLHRLLRIGKTGMIVDNQASGGVACGLSEKGEISGFAVNKYGEKFKSVNGRKLPEGELVPEFNNFLAAADNIARRFHYSRLLGIDLCMDRNGSIQMIEVNDSNNEINFYQMTGGSLFGQYTDEIVQYCRSATKSFMIDFDL